jgi:hypothetical protein
MMPVAASTRRMALLSVSAMNTLPELSNATAFGEFNAAMVAGPLSPVDPTSPVPAYVVMMPVVALTMRIRLFMVSAMNTLPALSTATPCEPYKVALLAGPPSPLAPFLFPLPANVVIVPVANSTRRILTFMTSAMKKLPELSTATPVG